MQSFGNQSGVAKLDQPYQSPSDAKNNDLHQRMRPWPYVSAFALLVVLNLLLLNVVGWNVYLYLSIGPRDLIIGASCGVSHNAIAPRDDSVLTSEDRAFIDEFQTTLVHLGPLHLFAERRGEKLLPFQCRVFDHGDGYVGFELPLLALVLAFGVLVCVFVKRRNRSAA